MTDWCLLPSHPRTEPPPAVAPTQPSDLVQKVGWTKVEREREREEEEEHGRHFRLPSLQGEGTGAGRCTQGGKGAAAAPRGGERAREEYGMFTRIGVLDGGCAWEGRTRMQRPVAQDGGGLMAEGIVSLC